MTRKSKSAEVVLITGGASGIGLAAAERLIKAGWSVAIADMDEKALAAARAAFEKATVAFERLDVTDEEAVRAAIDRIEAKLGPLTGVVNSAGIAADKHVFDTTPALMRRILDVNVVGLFTVAQAAAERMKARGRGSIVNIASVAGVRGSKGRSAYGGSKGAVITMTQSMANDLARFGIRVNAIAPGPIETPMVKALHTAADRKLYERFIPMRRYAEPGEIASVIHFLLDPSQSAYVTGEIIAVDGGYRGAGVIVRD